MLNGYTPDFLEWYDCYPLKKAKMHSFKIWQKLQKQRILPDISELKEAIENQKKEKLLKYSKNEWVSEWPHPGSWLNACRWEDEVQIPEYEQELTLEEKWAKRVTR